MTTKTDGGQAYPTTRYAGNTDRRPVEQLPGMTLRDYFAAAALTGLCTAQTQEGEWQTTAPSAALAAYEYADAMLAERSK